LLSAYLKQYGIISDRTGEDKLAGVVVYQSLQEAMGIDPQVAQLRQDLINLQFKCRSRSKKRQQQPQRLKYATNIEQQLPETKQLLGTPFAWGS
jgi:hypothetical protein